MASDRQIYLDYAATSPVDPAVLDAMTVCLRVDGVFANPSSDHSSGAAARRLVEDARARVAELVGAPARRIVFTSGGTESNNTAIKGMFPSASRAGSHLVTTCIEHLSVLDTARALASDGVSTTLVDCDPAGLVAAGDVDAAIRENTRLVSVMHVNNEIGSVQDIRAIAEVCRARGVPLHVDAAQSAGKVELDIAGWGIDLCSLTAHKINGPKGVGALYLREGLQIEPLLHGGEQELGIRPGTLATHQIVGMGCAFTLADPAREGARLAALRDSLWAGLSSIDGISRNGDPRHSAPHILNVSVAGVDGESLRLALGDIAVSAGSACTSDSPDASHVLTAIGLSDARAQSSLRFGVGRFTGAAEIDAAVERVRAAVERLRRLAHGAPGWCSA